MLIHKLWVWMNRILPALQIGSSLQCLEYNLSHLLGVVLIKCILFNILRLMQVPYITTWPSKADSNWLIWKPPKGRHQFTKYSDINVSTSGCTAQVTENALIWTPTAFTECSRIIHLFLNGNCVKSYF